MIAARQENRRRKVEDVFSSKSRMKILKVLLRLQQMNATDIAERVNASYKFVMAHIKILEEENIINHKNFGKIRLYRFNEASPESVAVQRLIETWEENK